jgi:lipoate-protein ligase A
MNIEDVHRKWKRELNKRINDLDVKSEIRNLNDIERQKRKIVGLI